MDSKEDKATEVQIGQIRLIIGPMFSGKSTELIRRLESYKVARKSVLVVKHKKDNRYNGSGIATHWGQVLPAVSVGELAELEDTTRKFDIVGIDEGQFFPDIADWCEKFANRGKIVLVAALDGDFKRSPFTEIMKLVPLAEEVCKLRAVCNYCSKDAAFSKRLTEEKEIEVIGGTEKYKAVCRVCYFSEVDTQGCIEEGPEKKIVIPPLRFSDREEVPSVATSINDDTIEEQEVLAVVEDFGVKNTSKSPIIRIGPESVKDASKEQEKEDPKGGIGAKKDNMESKKKACTFATEPVKDASEDHEKEVLNAGPNGDTYAAESNKKALMKTQTESAWEAAQNPQQEDMGDKEDMGDLGGALNDPEIMAAAAFKDISTNPASISKYQNNPKDTALVNKMASELSGEVQAEAAARDSPSPEGNLVASEEQEKEFPKEGIFAKKGKKESPEHIEELQAQAPDSSSSEGQIFSSSADEIPLPFDDYFSFLLYNWASVQQKHPKSSPKKTQDQLWKHWSKANGRVASLRAVDGDVKVKGEASKETVTQTSSVSPSSSDEISLPVAEYFALHWDGMHQKHPKSSPKKLQDLLWKQWSLTNGRVASLRAVDGDVKVKGEASKETVTQTSSVSPSSSDDIPLPVAKYFGFVFSHWAGMRKKHPNSSPEEIQGLLWKQWSLANDCRASLGGVEGDVKVKGEALMEGGPAKKKAKKEENVEGCIKEYATLEEQ